jgi:hypothetical protein
VEIGRARLIRRCGTHRDRWQEPAFQEGTLTCIRVQSHVCAHVYAKAAQLTWQRIAKQYDNADAQHQRRVHLSKPRGVFMRGAVTVRPRDMTHFQHDERGVV